VDFLLKGRELLEGAILEAELDGTPVSAAELLGGKSIRSDYVALKIISTSPSA
jgi:hypothetical protein